MSAIDFSSKKFLNGYHSITIDCNGRMLVFEVSSLDYDSFRQLVESSHSVSVSEDDSHINVDVLISCC